MSTQLPEAGKNRTTRSEHPEMYDDMKKGPEKFRPTSHGDLQDLLTEMRGRYIEQNESIGHVPEDELADVDRVELMDKLGERLAFERTGTRLYEGVLSKLDWYGSFGGGPERADLERMHREEHEHFMLIKSVITRLGGDPGALTPSADVAATLSRGVIDVVADPRANLLTCLEAILVAELTDHASWGLLVELARKVGETDYLEAFEQAYRTEEDHVESARRWVEAAHGVD